MDNHDNDNFMGAIAIIGMAGRFPGACNMDEFWRNLYHGVESVQFFSHDELIKMGIDERLLDNPRFVAADAILDGMDMFDASFFDYSAREAEIMDPQHRLFLESAWEALENAGYHSGLYQGRIAVYGSANLSGYMIRNLYSNPELVENVGSFKIMLANGQDFLATKVSYKMNLTGPSVNVNTLCSSSMVAVYYGCQNLLNYGCDIALAGGVSFQVSRNEAFFYQEGGIGSSDGHCRAYDSKANGTVSGSGLAIVVLKRLEEAIADGDHICAVIRGVGLNNDGSFKNSYTAPNVDGQAECIAEAIAMSGVDPETITYIDGHGTGTDLGDPIEIAALTKAFRAYTGKKQFCAIGSVKTNIGHLVNAGGLASLFKTVLAMQHKIIPPSLNFKEPNAKIDFVNSPFYVNTRLSKWESHGCPLRAGVSSFGIGGTNTHVILEEAPEMKASGPSKRPYQLICLAAKTGTALETMTGNFIEFVKNHPELNPADVAFTLHLGRRNFNHRRFVIFRDLRDFEKIAPDDVSSRFQKPKEQPVVFMFPGQGEYANLGGELLNTESFFRSIVEKCAGIMQSLTGINIRKTMFPGAAAPEGSSEPSGDYRIGKGSLFIIEYALARLWIHWGVKPQSMIGEGTGEYVAACLAGVLSLEDALNLAVAKDETLARTIAGNSSNHNPIISFISCATGKWASASELESPDYWLRQRMGSQFTQGMQEVLHDPDQILLEIGPGCRLAMVAESCRKPGAQQSIFCSLPQRGTEVSEAKNLLKCLGEFWLAGGMVAWAQYYDGEKRHRIPLPTYPFERQRYWIEPAKRDAMQPDVWISRKEDITDEVIDKGFKEGRLTLTLNLAESADSGDLGRRKEQLEAVLKLKEHLEEICRGYREIFPQIGISALGLGRQEAAGQYASSHSGQFKKRPRPELETVYAAPRNEAEKVIIEKWQEVLGFDKIGIHDDFFQLGGHSLIAAAVATDLSRKFNVQIPMRTLFETTTAAGIAELIETYLWAAAKSEEDSKVDDELEGGTI